ncbi:MAG: hypothetical protein KGJ06_03450 [Pseudomonadota bacterium]|nr:hypothetical protein [Pseudomonadota bacterium]
MKKHAAILGLAALVALPACTSQPGYQGRGDNSSMSPNQSYSQAGAEYDERDHKEGMDRKLDAMVDRFFAEADTNHDGYISRKEYDRFFAHKFKEADKNHDGKLSRDEVRAMKRHEMKAVHREMHGEHHGGDGMRSDEERDRDNFSADGSDNNR